MIPTLLCIGCLDRCPADVPLPFHKLLLDESSHQKDSPMAQPSQLAVWSERGASSTGAGTSGSYKTCHL